MKVVIFGVGQLAEVIGHYLENDPRFEIAGFVVDNAYLPDTAHFAGKPVVAWERITEVYPPKEYALLGPISYRKNNNLRKERYLEGKSLGYKFASFVHPSSHVTGARIGENSILLEDCTVQPFATLGVCSILWSKVHIGHHAQVDDYCFFASFCGVAGNARIGERVFFGGQTGVTDNLSVGDGCIIGAGAIVTQDMAPNSVAVGANIRVLKNAAHRLSRHL